MKKLLSIIIFTIILSVLPGCSSSEKHTTTTTTVSDPSGSADSNDRVVKTETTESHESHDDHDSGGLFSIIGNIIAWPFRVVGATLSAIF